MAGDSGSDFGMKEIRVLVPQGLELMKRRSESESIEAIYLLNEPAQLNALTLSPRL